MAASGMKLFGDKELERKFTTLGERVQRRVLRGAISAAARHSSAHVIAPGDAISLQHGGLCA